ncbi:MAG: ABC transporter permease [Thermoleophilaceae bacterium]|nr:ABC transporter permease [Thermoleophilaceae bacterium]
MSVESATRTPPVVHQYTDTEFRELAERMPSRVLGPQALSGSPKRFIALTWMLAYLDFKLKFFGSILGYAWQLVKPLAMFGVLYFVFTEVVRLGEGVPHYGVVLLSGIVLMSFFTESTVGAIGSVLGAEGLIRKIAFPIMAIPLASVTSVFLTLFLNYGVVMLFAVANGVKPMVGWLQIVPLLFLLYLVAASVAVSLSAYYVRFRDVQPIWEVIAQVLFYASPVIYPISFVQERSETLAKIMMCNPVATIIEQMRHAAIDPTAPSAVDVLGSWWMLAIPMGIVVLLALFGYFSMKRLAPTVAEEM